MPPRTFVATWKLDEESSAIVTALRTRYFPPERNFLDAHATLFHQLDEDGLAMLEDAVASAAPRRFDVEITDPFPMGRGVALRVESARLSELRGLIAAHCRPALSAQDRQPYRPHVTIQNKVSAEEAARTLIDVRRAWRPIRARVEGIVAWEYRGGPWSFHEDLPFEPES